MDVVGIRKAVPVTGASKDNHMGYPEKDFRNLPNNLLGCCGSLHFKLVEPDLTTSFFEHFRHQAGQYSASFVGAIWRSPSVEYNIVVRVERCESQEESVGVLSNHSIVIRENLLCTVILSKGEKDRVSSSCVKYGALLGI